MIPRAPSPSKDTLRARFSMARVQMSDENASERSTRIADRVLDLPVMSSATRVHTYWPLLDRNEVDTRPIITSLYSRGVDVVLPVVTSFTPGSPDMEHRRYEGRGSLTVNRWGIAEPDGTELVRPSTCDVVLVPALGAGRNGHRIGNGAGYYDAFLASVDAPTVALVYDDCFVDVVPYDEHDVPVSWIVTDQRTVSVQT